jgi:Fic family protein
MVLDGNPLSKKEMLQVLSASGKKLSAQQEQVVDYKTASDYINQEWLVNPKVVSPKTILTLHALSCQGKVRTEEVAFGQFLDYLQISKENPIIQAAMAQAYIAILSPFTIGNGRVARLLAQLFLYKSGFDFRGMLVLEEYWLQNRQSMERILSSVSSSGNVTLWLELFTQAVNIQLEKAAKKIDDLRFEAILPATYWDISDRQKYILTKLEQPGNSITNRQVQKHFHVSQITASRDLTKLVALGLIYAHGKGRSVHYTGV